MQFEFMKEVAIKTLTANTKMTGIMHKQQEDGSIDVLFVHGAEGPHKGVLVSVVPINMPADALEELNAEKTA